MDSWRTVYASCFLINTAKGGQLFAVQGTKGFHLNNGQSVLDVLSKKTGFVIWDKISGYNK